MAASGIVAGISFFFGGLFYYYSSSYPFWVPAIGVLILVSSLMGAAGYYGQYHNYGSGMGAAAAIYILIAGMLFLILTVTSIRHESNSFSSYSSSSWITNVLMTWGAHIIFGVAVILMGISNVVSRFHMGLPGLGSASGVVLIIGGSFIISYFLSFVGFFMLTAGAICAGINFVRAMVYDMDNLTAGQAPVADVPAYGWPQYQNRPPY
jgi:hypothetical protein